MSFQESGCALALELAAWVWICLSAWSRCMSLDLLLRLKSLHESGCAFALEVVVWTWIWFCAWSRCMSLDLHLCLMSLYESGSAVTLDVVAWAWICCSERLIAINRRSLNPDFVPSFRPRTRMSNEIPPPVAIGNSAMITLSFKYSNQSFTYVQCTLCLLLTSTILYTCKRH